MAPSVCSACQAGDKTLSRCSQCMWTAYCSKTCQRDHWKAGHRRVCAKLQVCQRFRDLERQWWTSRPSDELQTFVVQFGLQPDSMKFFGEVFFLLCGLKACVLLSNLPPTWRHSFANGVVTPSGLLKYSSPDVAVALYAVGTRLVTPAKYELSGDLVLTSTLHAEFQAAERTLRLQALTTDTNLNASGVAQEHDLARILDYPVALSECTDNARMVEVGYFMDEGQQQVLLTSYCASATPHHAQRVQHHFERYQACSRGIQLVLRTSQI